MNFEIAKLAEFPMLHSNINNNLVKFKWFSLFVVLCSSIITSILQVKLYQTSFKLFCSSHLGLMDDGYCKFMYHPNIKSSALLSNLRNIDVLFT